MTEEGDWLDELLRTDPSGRIQDNGFTDLLMARLPRHRPEAFRWIVPATALIGAVSSAMVSTGHGLLPALQNLIVQQRLEAFALLPIALIWAACAWGLSESR
jgi:hypothetical protein